MSLAVLKKKSVVINGRHTVGSEGFSINGKSRMSGIAQGMKIGRVGTVFKGEYPVGHGGGGRCRSNNRSSRCDSSNEYPVVVQRHGCCTMQTLVKRSVQSTKGYLESRSVCCKEVVKENQPLNPPYVCRIVKEEKKCGPYVKGEVDHSYSSYNRGLACPMEKGVYTRIKKQFFS